MKTCLEHNSRQRLKRLLTLALWCAAAIVLLWQFIPMLFGNRTLIPADNLFQFAPYRAAAGDLGVTRPHIPLYSDLILQNYPWWRFIRQSLGSNQLPLWNPYTFSGTPFLAKGQHLALYPLSAPFYILPLERAYAVFIILHFGLAAWTAAFLARTVGISRFGALLSGLTYGLSGFMLARAVFPMIIAAAAWLPLILAMAEKIITRSRYRGRPAMLPWILFGALGLGMQALAGHPEILIYTLLTLSFYTLWRILAVLKRRSASGAATGPWHAVPGLALMVMLGLLIGAIQLLPQYLVLQENFRRQAAAFNQILAWSFPWQQAVTLLVPNYFGNPARYAFTNLFTGLPETMLDPIGWGAKNFVEGAAYVGILPLLLAPLSLLRPRSSTPDSNLRRQTPSPLFFLVLTVLALCFVFGTPLYYLIYILPGMEQIHSPFRWSLVSTLGIAILAGYGIDMLRRRPSSAMIMARCCATGGALLLLGLLLIRMFFKRLEPLAGAVLLHSGGNSSVFPDPEAFFSYEAPWFVLLAVLLVCSGLVFRAIGSTAGHQESRGGTAFWQPAAVLVIAADLFIFVHGLYPGADPALLRYTPDIITRMRQDHTLWRFTTYDPEHRKSFPANAGWLHTIQDIRGYDSIFSSSYRRYMETVDVQDELLYNRIAPLRSPAALDSPLLDLLNVKYLLSEHSVANPRYLLESRSDGMLLYRNTGVLPRAFTLPLSSTVRAEDPFAAMRRFDPRFYMILPAGDTAPGGIPHEPPPAPVPGKPRAAVVAGYRNNEVTLTVSAEEPVWLVLADSYDPGWRASGWPADDPDRAHRFPVRRAYGAFRAVMVEEGDWVVRYRYTPPGFVPGVILTLAGGGLAVTGLLTLLRTPKNSAAAKDTSPANRHDQDDTF